MKTGYWKSLPCSTRVLAQVLTMVISLSLVIVPAVWELFIFSEQWVRRALFVSPGQLLCSLAKRRKPSSSWNIAANERCRISCLTFGNRNLGATWYFPLLPLHLDHQEKELQKPGHISVISDAALPRSWWCVWSMFSVSVTLTFAMLGVDDKISCSSICCVRFLRIEKNKYE